MKALRSTVLAVATLATLAACAGVSVTSDWDPGFDFSAPRTFTLLDHAGGQPLDRLNDARVRNAIVTVMEGKGFQEVADTAEADISVGYQFASEERSSYQTVNTGWTGYGYGGYGGWYGGYGGMGMATSTTTEQRYEEGSLLIAVFDTQAREMVYQSTGTKTLADSQPDPEEAQRRITDAVTAILADFPPGR